MAFTRDKLRQVNMDVLAVLKAVEAKHGITITQGRSHFDGGATGDMTLKYAVVNAVTGAAELDANTKWALTQYGLTDELVKWPGKHGHWKITGYNSRAPKYPISVSNDFGGQGYRIPLSTAQRYFGKTTRVPKNPPVVPVIQTPQAQIAPSTPQRQYDAQF